MKTKFLFLYLIILSSTIFFSLGDEDSCPIGMRKTYVDDKIMLEYGSARKYMAAVAFFQFPGSLFFKRRVLIEPRFEVHLKASIDPVDIVEKAKEQKLYGFTIVISGYNNTISGLETRNYKNGVDELVFNDIGYNNFVNALIIEFDFEKDTYDPDSSSFSIRYCQSSCFSEDYKAVYYNKLNSQRYDPKKVNNWDFRLIYNSKKLYLYSGPNDIIYSLSVDLEKTLKTNIGFVGFTGFMESNKREITLFGSFMCEDNYEISKMPGNFLVNGNLLDYTEYEAGTPINYLFSFINNKDQLVPHTFGYNIWDYNFTLNTDCGLKSYSMAKQTNYTLILSINACTKAGKHKINIAEERKGNAPERYYMVRAGPMKKVTLIGHDEIIAAVPLAYTNNIPYLIYGDSPKGNFIIKQDLKLVLDFDVTDQYGNPVTVSSPNTLFNLKKVNEGGSTTVVTPNIISYTNKPLNGHYQMTILVNKIGTYQIENEHMASPLRFIVVPGEASLKTSYCTLKDYTSAPSLQQGQTVYYNCYLRDDLGNEIDTKTFLDNSIYDFTCQTQRTAPTSITYKNTVVEDNKSYYTCKYPTSDTGVFLINGFLTKKGTSISNKIEPKINQFSVRGNANSLIIKNALNLYNNKWLDATGAEITYVFQQNGYLTALDLAESDGKTLISSYGKYPEGFDVSKLKAEFSSPHDPSYRFDLVSKIIYINGVEYIGLFTKNNKPTSELAKKSSFLYSIKATLQKSGGNDEKTIMIKYPINIGSYTTCFHNFNREHTSLDQAEDLELLTGGAEMKIGKIELKTDDYYLYNYDIGKDKIQYLLQPSSDKIKFRIVPLSIEGTYDVYAQSFTDYDGWLIVKVDGYQIRKQRIKSNPSLACYLEFIHPEYFIHKGDEFKEHYYEYIGPYTDGNLLFQFIIKDKYGNIIAKDDYFSCYADIYCLQYGNDLTKFTIFYNKTAQAYQFRDKLPFDTKQYTWVFFMRESTCNNKYYINYDGMRGVTKPSIEKSYFNLLKNEININEYAYVDVFYKDDYDQFLGLKAGKLEEMRLKTKVVATNEDKTVSVDLEFDSITSSYAIRYKKKFTVAGTFKVSVTAENEALKCRTSDTLNVIDNIYSLKHSKLKLILDTIIDMDPNVRVTIDNTIQEPVYQLYFYSKTGVKTTYDPNTKFTCFMTGDKVNMELNVEKKTDYVQFTHKDDLKEEFKALIRGDYQLKVSDDKETVLYPLYLTGDGSNDTTNDPNYLIDKTEVHPTHIDGVAGKTYTVNVEFRVEGGFRWNYDVDTTKLTVANSYNLKEDKLTIKVERGYKKGQAIIYVTQFVVTNEQDNVLTLFYDGKKIPKTVSLTIKCADLAKLVYVDGPTEGNVIDPPILTFKPVDKYGNLYTDLFTEPQSQDYLNSLTIGKADVPLTSNNYLDNNQYLKVQYISRISTDATVTSTYFEESYKYRIRSGPIDKYTSYAELKNPGTKEAGEEYNLVIYPKDKYNNDIDDLSEKDMEEFYPYYGIIGTTDNNPVTDCVLADLENPVSFRKLKALGEFDFIDCQAAVTKTGALSFHVNYLTDEIECRNCEFLVVSNNVDYLNTKTYYTNKKYYLNESALNEVEAKVEPVFELTFFDKYLNQLDEKAVQKLNIQPTLEGSDIKLCIANQGNKKVVTLCQSTNGDDNINKWQFITNGENYKLKLQDKDNKDNVILYPIKITDGDPEGSSEETDLSKTVFIPDVIRTKAGVEGKTVMELRTAKEIRKNYWYPNPSEMIKVDFDYDKNNCTYKIEEGDQPGQYAIKVTCTKTNDNNAISVTVNSTKIEKKVKLIVESGPAYYLEVVDVDKFNVNSDKYTWKVNPTNDDTVLFSFKLLDKYHNYIKHSVLENNEITISSDTFGTSEKYYSISFNDQNINYLFTDKIDEVITKHIWNIVCVESGRKYSFIYTKVPGKVDVTKSYWTIDKTNYILNETSTVLVTLCDRLGVNVGIVEGRLLKEKDLVSVVTNNGKDKPYNYNSITKDNQLKYLYVYQLIGKYEVSVSYNKQQIEQKKEVTVSYQVIDLKNSKLYYDKYDGKENLMKTTEQTNIYNQKEYIFYKMYLYTAKGEPITVYDKNVKVTCKMTYSESDDEWVLDVTKENSFMIFTYEDGFRTTFEKLPLGSYSLVITIAGEEVTYPLYLLGEKSVSPSNVYDLTKTYINPTYIDGIAGVQYQIDIEFRAKDNLRWNYEINLNSFEITNSYNLNKTDLIIVKELGEKNGQMKLLVTQNIASFGGTDNVLSFTYKYEAIPTTVTLHIKCADLAVLEYHSGCKDGTVVNPSILKFIPKDKFGNIYTDLFDEKLYPKEKLEKLTNGVSVEGFPLTTNNWVSDGKFLNVQYGCKNVTTIKVTLNQNLNPNTYKYKLWSGPIDPDHSYAEIEKTVNVKAGDITKLKIYPKDIYGNNVTNMTKDDLEKFNVDYEINKDDKVDISNTCNNTNKLLDQVDCKTNITKAGDIAFTVDYSDKPIFCRNCEFVINPDKIDFSKTKVFNKNENKEMSRTELNVLPVTILPNFELYFFDRFKNPVTNKTEVEQLKVGTTFEVTDVKLCVSNNGLTKLSSVCPSANNDENQERWFYLPDGEKYKLIATKLDTSEHLNHPVKLTGGYKENSPEPIDPNKTTLTPTELTLIAGEEDAVKLELRTKNSELKNYWFKEPEKHLLVKFPDDVKTCKYSLDQAEKPGQYYIKFNCTEARDNIPTTVFVEDTEVPQKINITVVPGAPFKSRLFRLTGEEITKPDLGSVCVEDKFQMINKLYDRFDNLITNLNFQLSTLQIKIAPLNTVPGHSWSAEPLAQKNGEILITLKSTLASEHTVTGLYFPLEKYKIIFTHGAPDADNSLLEVSKTEAWVGEPVKVYITPYDKYNNYIDANEFAETSPYQVKYTSPGSTLKVIMVKYKIEKKDDLNVLSYDGAFFVKGITKFNGFIDIKEIKCVTCRINIKAKDIDFLSSYVLRYESSKNDFETLKNGAVEKNTKEEPIYRLYPRDQYLNDIEVIPKEKLETYESYLRSQKENVIYHLKLNNKELTDQAFAEFVINDDKSVNKNAYKDLVKGFYDLVFTDGKDELKYNITLAGDEHGGSNEDADPQKTYLLEENLKFVAGNTGYMMLEVRTANNIRKNDWDGFTFDIESCDPTDKTFGYTQDRAGMKGVFMITVTTQKANTYPKLKECPLKIFLNKEEIKDLNPKMEVSPDVVVKTEILEKYYKKGSKTNLLDGTADEEYPFEVASYDQYDNLAETIQEVVGIKVALKGGDEVKKMTSETDPETGYRGYRVTATVAGTYVVSTDKAGPQGLYLAHESIFVIHPGAIDLSKTIIKEKATPIQAGTHPAVSIEAFDKHGNALNYTTYINNFTAVFIDPKKKDHDSKAEYDSNAEKVYYTSLTPVTVVGFVKVEVTFNKDEKLDTSKVLIEVIPGDVDPKNSILSRETSKGVITQYKNGDSFTVDVKEYLILNVTLYDKYNNYISNIPADVKIVDPTMSGNYMDEIKFNVTQNNGYFELDFNDNANYVYIYQHLVKGTYDLTYVVNTSLAEASFKYHIIIPNGDDTHGNNKYVIEKCVLKPKKVSFVAGNYEQFTLELRTAQDLLYNDDIDVDKDLEISVLEGDKSFTSSVTKAEVNGIYTIKIYSEIMGDYTMSVKLTDPASANLEKKEVGPGYYTVFPDKVPDKRYTVITERPDKEGNATEIDADKTFVIEYTLADKFNNSFIGRRDMVDNKYLTLINNEEPLEVVSLALKEDNRTYKMVVYPKYPPKEMSMNVLYNDEENSVFCFMDNINLTIKSELDPYLTQIVSKNKDEIKVGETLDMKLYTFDKKGECLGDKDYSKDFEITVVGPSNSDYKHTKTYKVLKTNNNTQAQCDNEYEIITTDEDKYKYAGNYIIYVRGKDDVLIGRFNQVCKPGDYALFFLDYDFDPDHISILDTVSFTVSGTDKYGNKLEDPLLGDLTIGFTQDNKDTPFEGQKSELVPGKVVFDVSIHVVGPHQLHLYYKGNEVLTVNNGEKLPIFTIIAGPCRANNNDHFDLTPLNETQEGEIGYFTFQCYDIYNNKITHGGEQFTVNGQLLANDNEYAVNNIEVIDNKDGKYIVRFLAKLEGTYLFNIFVGSEKYGDEVVWTLKNKECSIDEPILCPNNNKCVKDLLDCVPDSICKSDRTKPFYCKVNDTMTCVASMTDCDCPLGYYKCPIMKYCVKEHRQDMCAYFNKRNKACISKFGESYAIHYDGICREKDYHPPNQRVCPLGQVLCADLSCRNNYDECIETEVCPETKIRCIGQQIVSNSEECPSTYTCPNKDDYVCPRGECVSNEMECKASTKCNDKDKPYRCENDRCESSFDYCTQSVACGDGFSLCPDSFCRIKC